MYTYISEMIRIMMSYGSSHKSFIPLLWAGKGDWESSSAWTRGRVRFFSWGLIVALWS